MADRLAEIREREAKATAGPWASVVFPEAAGSGFPPHGDVIGPPMVTLDRSVKFTIDDADFISHAREDIPWLIAENERLRNELQIALQANIPVSEPDDPNDYWTGDSHV